MNRFELGYQIGTGLGGLTCALDFEQARKEVLVLDASDLKSPMLARVFKSYTGF
jgi:hypothetical protein